jgi:hypothetical protein
MKAQLVQTPQALTKFSSQEFFNSDQLLDLTVSSDFKKLRSQKHKGLLQPATVTLYLSPTDSLVENIGIWARGEFRRTLCQTPSLMVDFKKDTTSSLKGLKKMKLVCGCSPSSYNENLVLLEHLAYKIYNQLTDMSFKTRLVRITFKDVNSKIKSYTQYAFFIEDVDAMAKRNNCREYEKRVNSSMANRNQMTLMSMFQFLIGNTDWSIPNFHNIKFIQSKADSFSAPYIVPYDFDFSGLVNASYAYPNQELFGIEKVTERLYRGLPRSEEEIENVLTLFKSKKDTIMELVNSFTLLKPTERKTVTDYLAEFYKMVDDKRAIRYQFVNGFKQN